jgi:hypothetical protein
MTTIPAAANNPAVVAKNSLAVKRLPSGGIGDGDRRPWAER